MKQCPKCKGENFKVLRHYEFYDIYECIDCGYWTYAKNEECCRDPHNIVVIEWIDHFKYRLFYQCINCGYANRAKCLNSKKFGEQVESDFDNYRFDERVEKKLKELNFIKQQFQYYKNSKYFKYHEYLNSPEWKEKRKLALERDNFICQHCKNATAEDVHHISYDKIYNEPLYDLLSVCRTCHHEIHKSFLFDDGKRQ